MENKLEITKEKVLEAASKCPTAKEALKTLFPECFNEPTQMMAAKTDDAPDNQVVISHGGTYYTVHGSPERFTIIKSVYPKASSGAWKTFTGNVSGKLNAESWVIKNTKRFTLDDVYFACSGETKQEGTKGMGCIVSKLNDRNHPDLCIDHYDET